MPSRAGNCIPVISRTQKLFGIHFLALGDIYSTHCLRKATSNCTGSIRPCQHQDELLYLQTFPPGARTALSQSTITLIICLTARYLSGTTDNIHTALCHQLATRSSILCFCLDTVFKICIYNTVTGAVL